MFLELAEDGGFESRERKVVRAEFRGGSSEGASRGGEFRVGEGVFLRIAGLGGFADGGAAGVGKTEKFSDFVETFADGVVAGGADNFEVGVGFLINDLSVAAGDEEGEGGEGWLGGSVGDGAGGSAGGIGGAGSTSGAGGTGGAGRANMVFRDKPVGVNVGFYRLHL